MCPMCKWLFVAALAAGIVALAGGAFVGGDAVLPDQVAQSEAPAAVAPAPDGLSTVTTTRDWQETAGSPTRRAWR